MGLMKLKNLKPLRKYKGITQKQAAAIFNVSTAAYNAWELGDAEPSIKTLIEMADYFNCSVDYLMGRNEDKELSPEERDLLDQAAEIIKKKVHK